MNNIREKFEKQIAIMEANLIHDNDAYFEARPNINTDDYKTIFNAGYKRSWQAATEQSQKEIAEKDARIAELEDYKNSVIDQFVTAHHSYDDSISAYENISKLIAYHQDIALDPKVSSVAAGWVTQIEALQAREKELVEALQNLVEDISKTHGNYTYEQAWINADEALANVRGD